MKVLIAASECAPLVKVGGVADVIGSLPISLKKTNVDARVVIPCYKPLIDKYKTENQQLKEVLETKIKYSNEELDVIIYETTLADNETIAYLIYEEKYLSNGGIYYSPQNMKSPYEEIIRFAVFSKAITDIFTYEQSPFSPDIIHANDWHTGMIPQLIQKMRGYTHEQKKVKTIFTIHNLAYQGFGSIDIAAKMGLNVSLDQTLKWDAQDDNLDFILQGIVGADYVTTVSEKYSQEIMTQEYGEGLHEILKAREGRVTGILNGISYDIFSPEDDIHIKHTYTKSNYKEQKAKNKRDLQEQLELNIDEKTPIIALISRLAQQKGLDLVASCVEKIIEMGYQVVILGTGDPQLEAKLAEKNETLKDTKSYKALIEFSEGLARQIYASSDMFLIPSRFEPCGLTQMIAMKYGSVPVVRETGGLYDTVENNVTGFTFNEFNKDQMLNAISSAYEVYKNCDKWNKIVKNCMSSDFSWDASANKYALLYQKVLSY